MGVREEQKNMSNQRAYNLRILEAVCIWLFFIQALRVIFSVLFGIIYDQVFAGPLDAWLGISVILVVFAFTLPAIGARHPNPKRLMVFAVITVVSRVGLSINDPQVRYWSAVIVLFAGGLYLASLMLISKRAMLLGFVLALSLDQVFRAVGQTYDVTLQESWIPVQVVWTILMLVIIIWLGFSRFTSRRFVGAPGIVWGLSIGGVLFLETSLLALPNAVARWTNFPYELITPVLLICTTLPLFLIFQRTSFTSIMWRTDVRYVSFGLLVICVLVGYFSTGLVPAVLLVLGQLILMSLVFYLIDSGVNQRSSAGVGLTIGLIFFLVLNFLNAFAFTYPYTLPFMRGMGWVVYLAALSGIGVALGLRFTPARATGNPVVRPLWVTIFVIVLVLITLISIWPQEISPFPQTGVVVTGTYNIHYGYDEPWHLSLEAQAKTIEESNADIVALQEVDTGRMTSYSIDNAYYLARRLHMNVVYLPTVEHLTGIAILHRGEALETDGQWISSTQEQTGVVYALLMTGDLPVHAFGTWIGLSNEDTLKQINEALTYIDGRTPAVFGGDFNSVAGSPVTGEIIAAGFVDPFTETGSIPAPNTSPAVNPSERIDYVWIRGVTPLEAWVPESIASDHRMVVTKFQGLP
jgi:endonuclease/exonuclease/phosphatase family metal-dependent hydrolase